MRTERGVGLIKPTASVTETVHADSEPLLLVVSVGRVCDVLIILGFQAHLSRVQGEKNQRAEMPRG